MAIIDADPYIPGGDTGWYVNQNNFYRMVCLGQLLYLAVVLMLLRRFATLLSI